MEKPACVKTHKRNMLILPEMIGSVVGIHTGKTFNQVEREREREKHYVYNYAIILRSSFLNECLIMLSTHCTDCELHIYTHFGYKANII